MELFRIDDLSRVGKGLATAMAVGTLTLSMVGCGQIDDIGDRVQRSVENQLCNQDGEQDAPCNPDE